MSSTGILKLVRKPNFGGRQQALDVIIDGTKIGNIANGKQENFDIAAGRHTVQVVKWIARSKVLDIEMEPNSSLELECGISPLYWKSILVFLVLWAFLSLFGLVMLSFGLDTVTLSAGSLGLVSFVLALITGIIGNFMSGGMYYLKRPDKTQPAR